MFTNELPLSFLLPSLKTPPTLFPPTRPPNRIDPIFRTVRKTRFYDNNQLDSKNEHSKNSHVFQNVFRKADVSGLKRIIRNVIFCRGPETIY